MTARRWLAVVAACAPIGGCGACEPDRSATPDAGPAAVSIAPAPPAPPPRPRVDIRPACRAIAVDGDVHLEPPGTRPDAGAPMAVQDRIPDDMWIGLGAKGRLVVRDPRTARETTAAGPGRARMCVDAQEESWLAGDGASFESSPGAGEAPGAEEWVVTELGVVRYTAARLGILVRSGGISVSVADGVAFVWPAQDATLTVNSTREGGVLPPSASDADGWERVAGPGRANLSARPRIRRDPAGRSAPGAVAQCTQLAGRTHDLAAALLAPPDDRPVGDSAPNDASLVANPVEQVRTRRLARAACAVANLRTAATTEDAPDIARVLKAADSAWRELPVVDIFDLRDAAPTRAPQ
jgi:hypothetical protein